jgi:hypothetical protein
MQIKIPYAAFSGKLFVYYPFNFNDWSWNSYICPRLSKDIYPNTVLHISSKVFCPVFPFHVFYPSITQTFEKFIFPIRKCLCYNFTTLQNIFGTCLSLPSFHFVVPSAVPTKLENLFRILHFTGRIKFIHFTFSNIFSFNIWDLVICAQETLETLETTFRWMEHLPF